MTIYTVVHDHRQGITLNSFKTLESAEHAAFLLKSELAAEYEIDLDDALKNDTLDDELAEFREFVYIQDNELQ